MTGNSACRNLYSGECARKAPPPPTGHPEEPGGPKESAVAQKPKCPWRRRSLDHPTPGRRRSPDSRSPTPHSRRNNPKRQPPENADKETETLRSTHPLLGEMGGGAIPPISFTARPIRPSDIGRRYFAKDASATDQSSNLTTGHGIRRAHPTNPGRTPVGWRDSPAQYIPW